MEIHLPKLVCEQTIIKEQYPQLIITPHELIHQWEKYLSDFHMNYQLVVNKDIQIKSIILITPKMVQYLPDMIFSRVIIDEAHRIKNM